MTQLKSGAIAVVFAGLFAPGIPCAEQKTFKSPVAAAQALVNAAQRGAREEVVAILGDEVREALSTGNAVQDQVEKAVMLKFAQEATRVRPDEQNHDRAIVILGRAEWPFPVPLIKEGTNWRFDGKAGMQEIENRTIGRNELGAMAACAGYVAAQLEFISKDRTGEGFLQFARKIHSSPEKHDGLYWSNDKGDDPSPLGPFVAKSAAVETTAGEQPAPFFGYYYQVLTGQGDNAAGGSRNFLIDGHMFGGFGLVAWPAEYGVTGVKTFIVNQLGIVYEKDLGARTSEAAKAMTRFDPDKSWKKSE